MKNNVRLHVGKEGQNYGFKVDGSKMYYDRPLELAVHKFVFTAVLIFIENCGCIFGREFSDGQAEK